MDINQELLSRYVDGQVSAAERQAVEQARFDDPHVAMELDDQEMLVELFGEVAPESVSEECIERLYALDSVSAAVAFEAIPGNSIRRRDSRRVARWAGWLTAAAAVLLAAVGFFQLSHKPEITLRDFARLTLAADGTVIRTDRADTLRMETGDSIAVGPRERVTYLDEQGARVILMPETHITLGDPREGELLSLDRGTALLTVRDRAEKRIVQAGGFVIESLGAEFGIRVLAHGASASGIASPASTSGAAVTVAVRTGRCEVRADGRSETSNETVEALWCVRLRSGAQIERNRIWESPLYAEMLRERGHELLAGFYSNESGVRSIRNYEWNEVDARSGGSAYEMVITANEIASVAKWLVFRVETTADMAFELVRTRPLADRPGFAEQSILRSPKVTAGTRVVAMSLAAFDRAKVETRIVEVLPSRSQLVRLQLRIAGMGTAGTGTGSSSAGTSRAGTPSSQSTNRMNDRFEVSASLWSARPPAEGAEVVR